MKNKILIGVIALASVLIVVILSTRMIKTIDKVSDETCFEFDKETGEITSYLEICNSEMVIPEKIDGVVVTKIKSFAFRNMGLTKVVIPGTVKEIGSGAFSDNEIKTLKLGEGIEAIKAYAFNNNKIEKLEIPKTVKTIGVKAFNKNELKTSDAFIYSRNEDGVEDKTNLIGYGGKDKDVTIPEGVTSIYLSALSENGIKSVKFSSTVERLEYASLEDNEIETIIIPASIMHLGEGALQNNPLTKIVIQGKKSLEEFNYLGENWNNGVDKITFE